MKVIECTSASQPEWLEMRMALWPDCTPEGHRADLASLIAQPARFRAFMALSDHDQPLGFAEASLRTDYVNGTETSPVAFLEGIYVIPEARRQGVASQLLAAVSRWAISCSCRELASDALLDNEISHAMHRSVGFVETERVVYFRKALS